MVFDSLVRELAAMREAAVQSLSALQAERDELEDKIRQAEEEIEQKVRADRCGPERAANLRLLDEDAARCPGA